MFEALYNSLPKSAEVWTMLRHETPCDTLLRAECTDRILHLSSPQVCVYLP